MSGFFFVTFSITLLQESYEIYLFFKTYGRTSENYFSFSTPNPNPLSNHCQDERDSPELESRSCSLRYNVTIGFIFPRTIVIFFISCWWRLQYVETFADHITFLKTYKSQYDIFKTFIFEALTRRKLRSTAYLEELRWVTTQKTHCNWTLKNCMMNYKTNCTALWT